MLILPFTVTAASTHTGADRDSTVTDCWRKGPICSHLPDSTLAGGPLLHRICLEHVTCFSQ